MVINQLTELHKQIEQNAKEAREDRKAIETRIEKLMTEGCAKVSVYAGVAQNQNEIFSRLRVRSGGVYDEEFGSSS